MSRVGDGLRIMVADDLGCRRLAVVGVESRLSRGDVLYRTSNEGTHMHSVELDVSCGRLNFPGPNCQIFKLDRFRVKLRKLKTERVETLLSVGYRLRKIIAFISMLADLFPFGTN